jgi:phosphate starvation-inducible protein PhoH and related proteins
MVMNKQKKPPRKSSSNFHVEWKNTSQKIAWTALTSHLITFFVGPAGTGKSFLSIAYGISEILSKRKNKLIITRPIVEAGESLGYLP